MEDNQKINCTVHSCRFQNKNKGTCSLNDITVKACPNCDVQTPEDSMCRSSKHK